jgi:[acyl-carrier-protein] S-malonyltransferase
VEKAAELAKSRGAKRAVLLPVSAPFHCALMEPAQERLAADLHRTAFRDPVFPVVNNIAAEAMRSGTAARTALVGQVTGAVQWVASIQALIAGGAETFIEVGPGRVLSGLMRQIDRNRTCLNVEDEASLAKVLAHFSSK